ncbi:Cell wall-associated murein hydrolase LytC [Streptococcus oralis]|uniref:Cell wall-associated murein hydrolase LytC n=1 Tax=Streptococcus oralis TaxID=1303 RepID=A0A139RLY6_STROR|nr:Cell wall-associated murein hydrolase LytC [Streptococcus oralis]
MKVEVIDKGEEESKEVAGLYITQKPKTDYLVGDQLDLAEGRFGVLYDDETEESHAFTDQGVEITGYDAQKTGRQTLTLHYKGHTAEFDVLVSPKAAVNDEYLKQEITAAQGRQSTLAYTFSSEDKQAALVEKLNAAKAVAENHNASQEEVNRALNELKQAGTDLDGNQRYQTAREELEALLESVREKDPKADLIEQAETLLASEMPTPQAFAEMKEKLNKKLAPAEESHHVGSMDPNEVAPTVEALPELVVETETTAFERQERPNAELLKGQRRVVQAGVEGQVRHFIEVDAQGKRTLRSTEVVKEAISEITEVGTKVLSSNQPAEGVKDLVLETPKLEVEEDTVAFERQERPNAELLKGQRRVVQAGVEGQVRRFVEVDAQGKRTLRSTEVLKEVLPEITEVGTKEEQITQTMEQTPLAVSAKGEEASKELPNTGATRDASLVALGLLGVMSSYGLLARKKRED